MLNRGAASRPARPLSAGARGRSAAVAGANRAAAAAAGSREAANARERALFLGAASPEAPGAPGSAAAARARRRSAAARLGSKSLAVLMAVILAVGLMPLPAFGDGGVVVNGQRVVAAAASSLTAVDADGNVTTESSEATLDSDGTVTVDGRRVPALDPAAGSLALYRLNRLTAGSATIADLKGYSSASGLSPAAGIAAAAQRAEDEAAAALGAEDAAVDGRIASDPGLAEQLAGMDFSTQRIVVALSDGASLQERDADCVASEGSGIYVLQYEDADSARRAYVRYLDHGGVLFAAPDSAVEAAEPAAGSSGGLAGGGAGDDGNGGSGSGSGASGSNGGNGGDGSDGLGTDAPVADLGSLEDGQQALAEDAEKRESEDATAPAAQRPALVALIDTAVPSDYVDRWNSEGGHSAELVGRVSAIGDAQPDVRTTDEGYSESHGAKMLAAILEANPDARVLSIEALDGTGYGSAATVYAALTLATAARADIYSMSFAGYAVAGNEAIGAGVEEALQAASEQEREVALLAAAGNQSQDARFFVPASYDGVDAVGALDPAKVASAAADQVKADPQAYRQATSNYGDSVDLWAPGDSTSFAAATAAGALSDLFNSISPDNHTAALQSVLLAGTGAGRDGGSGGGADGQDEDAADANSDSQDSAGDADDRGNDNAADNAADRSGAPGAGLVAGIADELAAAAADAADAASGAQGTSGEGGAAGARGGNPAVIDIQNAVVDKLMEDGVRAAGNNGFQLIAKNAATGVVFDAEDTSDDAVTVSGTGLGRTADIRFSNGVSSVALPNARYRLEAWGASGGGGAGATSATSEYVTGVGDRSGSNWGTKTVTEGSNSGNITADGGYSYGDITFAANGKGRTTVYAIVGQRGTYGWATNSVAGFNDYANPRHRANGNSGSEVHYAYNGGGYGYWDGNGRAWNGGGGMTHFSLSSNPVTTGTAWSNYSDTLLAAGGGGGIDEDGGLGALSGGGFNQPAHKAGTNNATYAVQELQMGGTNKGYARGYGMTYTDSNQDMGGGGGGWWGGYTGYGSTPATYGPSGGGLGHLGGSNYMYSSASASSAYSDSVMNSLADGTVVYGLTQKDGTDYWIRGSSLRSSASGYQKSPSRNTTDATYGYSTNSSQRGRFRYDGYARITLLNYVVVYHDWSGNVVGTSDFGTTATDSKYSAALSAAGSFTKNSSSLIASTDPDTGAPFVGWAVDDADAARPDILVDYATGYAMGTSAAATYAADTSIDVYPVAGKAILYHDRSGKTIASTVYDTKGFIESEGDVLARTSGGTTMATGNEVFVGWQTEKNGGTLRLPGETVSQTLPYDLYPVYSDGTTAAAATPVAKDEDDPTQAYYTDRTASGDNSGASARIGVYRC